MLVAYLAPTLLAGPDAHLLIHDNLDGEFMYPVHLARTRTVLDGAAVIPQIMNGLPRAALRPGLDFTVWLFVWLPPITAYLVNYAIVHGIAFGGMYFLLRRRMVPAVDPGSAALVALLFAMVPFYTIHGLTVAGQPIVLAAFLGILKHQAEWYDWAAITLFPFYSLLVLGGFYLVVGLAGMAAWWWWRTGRFPARAVVALGVLTILYTWVSRDLLEGAFGSGSFISHRTEFRPVVFTGTAIQPALHRALDQLAEGQYHAGGFLTLPIALLAGFAAMRNRARGFTRPAAALGAVIAAIAAWYAVYRPVIVYRLGDSIPQLNYVQLDRFYMLLPLLWFLLLGLSIASLRRARGRRVSAAVAVAAAVIGGDLTLRNDELRCSIPGGCDEQPSFREFYAVDLFTAVDSLTGGPSPAHRVASVGLHPSIAQYNGYWTADSYQNNYPLAYKHAFRRAIAPALEQSPRLRRYFDAWGSRAYLFSDEVNDLAAPKSDRHPRITLRIDPVALAGLEVRYILSAAMIQNADALGLTFVGTADHPDSFWRIHVYELAVDHRARVGSSTPTSEHRSSS